MKKITKISVLLAIFIATIGLTGCPDVMKSFGKDDFFGTWMTLDFDENGNRFSYYENESTGSYYGDPYVITWYFDGRSENMFNGTGGTFWQHLVHYDSATPNADGTYTFGRKIKETFWCGDYAIKGNSGYDKGKLYLYYECGYDFPLTSAGVLDTSNANYVSLEDLKSWSVNDFVTHAGLSGLDDATLRGGEVHTDSFGVHYYTNNNILIQIREVDGTKQCSDIEYFRFNLADGSPSGYTRMMATVKDKNGTSNIGGIYNQWAELNANGQIGTYKGGYKVYGSSSWSGQSTRYMGRISVTSTPDNPEWKYSNTKTNAELFKLVDASDSTDYADPDGEVRAEQ